MSLESQVPLGVVLSLFSALFYAAYLVFLRRKVDNEDKMDIPLFFGNYVNEFTEITRFVTLTLLQVLSDYLI